MKMEFAFEKKIIVGALSLVLAADGAMAIYSLMLASSAHSPQQQLSAERAHLKLLKADLTRAAAIQQNLPQTKADCERFENSLLRTNGGYSAISSELTEIGQHSGLQIDSLNFGSKDFPERHMSEISLEATVNGSYKSVVKFLNSLQRSQNHYVVDGLSLAPGGGTGSGGTLRVALHLRSFFKKVA